MKIPFASLFSGNQGGPVTALVRVRVGGVTIEPGTSLVTGTNVGGLDLTQYFGHDFEVVIENEIYIIKGIY